MRTYEQQLELVRRILEDPELGPGCFTVDISPERERTP